MARYDYECPQCGTFEVSMKMSEAGVTPVSCPQCGGRALRVYHPVDDIWHCEGSHKGDYGRSVATGTKADRLNRKLKRLWKEEPPPPAVDVPRNSSEKY